MATLVELRRRMGSVAGTRQITRAMELVSGVRLRRAQQFVSATRPFAAKLRELITHISASGDCSHPVFESRDPAKRGILVVIGSDKGLCGGFNNEILAEASRVLAGLSESAEVEVLPIGRKCREVFPAPGFEGAGEIGHRPDARKAARLALELICRFRSGEADFVDMLRIRHPGGRPETDRLLPIVGACEDWRKETDYIYEPAPEEILEEIIPRFISSSLLLAMAESLVAEHAARLASMASATRNADEMIRGLRLEYNKLRQGAITMEISELVGGAEVLEETALKARKARL
ncbi:ATP synthase F1 subunit gamma [Candidatus Fermentibacteria bacterium]|nr:ATP synthase F1 subunit gamma [Candidatus Fermentibacteria bacterium]